MVEATVEADHKLDAGLFHGGQDAIDAGKVEVDGFLAEDMLSGGGGGLDEGRVGVRAGADQHGIDVGVLEERSGICEDLGNGQPRCAALGYLFPHIRDRHDLGSWDARDEMLRME